MKDKYGKEISDMDWVVKLFAKETYKNTLLIQNLRNNMEDVFHLDISDIFDRYSIKR